MTSPADGGTSWSRIEHHRRRNPADTLGLTYQDWGLTTAEALRLNRAAHPDITLIASGGIRNGIDMAKAVLLGAELCGIAAPFLAAAQDSAPPSLLPSSALRREYRTGPLPPRLPRQRRPARQHRPPSSITRATT